ncbi:hypothetical protein MUN74_09600 [Agromyces endophyticus]|uniref:hypothetical protein n=1 Tax=Agromyces sp. H17E-10 TaxID=2932244 RepID=UPI001FD5E6D6|nr:hypothetical protein [Agromyces sp. H17E-10]UOQ91120.1 hypothetical protein MUN74_09600 [Agromyces sp. H17E-10]
MGDAAAGGGFETGDATGSSPFAGLNRFDETVGAPPAPAPYDPLRLCVFTTIALITCVLGPISLAVFAGIAISGYAKARRAGLLRSKCKLGDTRNVLAYLIVLEVLAIVAVPFWVMLWATALAGIGS